MLTLSVPPRPLRFLFGSILLLALTAGASLQAAAQACTGLCLQQVSCPGTGMTTISGVVYAPNGIDPLPNVLVYIPNAPVDAFTPGVSCPVVGQPPSGSPLAGTITAVDGSFVIANVPVGANIPLVIQTGRWRRQLVVPTTTACADTQFSTRMPKNQSEGDIPKIAVATGSQDSVECVLRKVGLDDAEFTNIGGTGRINLFSGSGSAGALIDTTTPRETALMADPAILNSYDALMLPCQGGPFAKPTSELANLVAFANAGGRVYSSHYSYVWMNNNPPFNTVVNWQPDQSSPAPDPGVATVDTSFAEGQTLSQWLQLVGATTTAGQMPISVLRHDFNGVVAPTQSWLALNNARYGNPVMQFVFDTPVGASANQCGRVLFNEYHVETAVANTTGKAFPSECVAGALTPQEKLLEYSLFELTGDGGQATLTPSALDFGSEPINFTTAPQTVTWKNNSTFTASVSSLHITGDFAIKSSNCTSVAAGASCQINVVFSPTAIGPDKGTLTVGAGGTSTSTASLTGVGIADLSVAPATLDFGNVDVGAAVTKQLTVTNNAAGNVAVPTLGATGDYTIKTNCPSVLAALASCSIQVTFIPTTTGARAGGLTVASSDPAYTGMAEPFTGNGVDFTLTVVPVSGEVVAGFGVSLQATTSPIAGFAAPVALSCTTNAPASLCTPAATAFTPSSPVVTAIAITTTSKYKVVGYAGWGGGSLLWLVAAGSGWLLWRRRHEARGLVRAGLMLLMLGSVALGSSGCSGNAPAQNASFTTPGTYAYTLSATDGFLTHTATYTLKVDAQ